MPDKSKHKEQQTDLPEEINKMISGIHISWDKSKEEVWPELERRILEASHPLPARVIFRPWMKIAVAAMITILLGLTVFINLHTTTIQLPAGQHSEAVLPDQSGIQINAQSVLSYKPVLWHFSRKVRLEGEAYFKVQHGRKFEVISGNCKTTVLGTDFNIYARENEYIVTCVNGSVKVTELINHNEVVLHPGQQAVLKDDHSFDIKSVNIEQVLSWLNKKLSFTSSPLDKVFEEIGRQYGVTISFPADMDFIYTGNFSRSISLEKALELVCKPFDLKFVKKSRDEYIIHFEK